MKVDRVYIIGVFFSLFLFVGCGSDDNGFSASSEAKLSLSVEEVEVGKDVALRLTGVDAEEIQKIQWSFGDGTVSDQKEVVHSYEAPGHYIVSVSAVFKSGEDWSAETSVGVYYPEVSAQQRVSITASLERKDYVQICAHRGYWKDAPENSVKAISLAIEKTIDMIEVDVRVTKDGEMVLMHDATIDRTTNGTGKVSELSYKELLLYNLLHEGELTEEKIPLFKDVLSAARGKIYIDIDVKKSDYKKVYDLVKRYGMISQVLFTAYDVATANKMVSLDKKVVLLPVIYEMQDLKNYLTVVKPLPVAQFNSKAFTDEILGEASKNGVAIFKNIYINTNITPTSDSYKQVKAFLEKKGNVIQTDYPVELKDFLKNN